MKNYHESLAELFKLACIYKDTIATANLAKLLELTTSPVEANAHWLTFRNDLRRIADTITLQQVDDYFSEMLG